MNEDLHCNICNISFKFKIAKQVHFDFKHNVQFYECEFCMKKHVDNYIHSSFYSLIDHLYKYHDEYVYSTIDYLNIY